MMKESKSAPRIQFPIIRRDKQETADDFNVCLLETKEKAWALKARAVKKNRLLDSLHRERDATRTFLTQRAHAGTRYPYYYLVLHLRVSASFRCYFAFLLPFFGSGMIRAHARLSWPPPLPATLPASAVIMDRSRKSEFNFPLLTRYGFNKWRNRVHARIKLEEIINVRILIGRLISVGKLHYRDGI